MVATERWASTPARLVREQELAARRAAPVRSLLGRVLGVHTDERAWRLGRQGEQAVAERLAHLPDTWRTLHSIPVGARRSDIDHLTIGPGGVYTINAKHHPDASIWVGGDCFMVNGRRQPYVRNSRHEAERAARLLGDALGRPVPVVGVIAVMGAQRGFTVREQPIHGAVHVITRKAVTCWLSGRPVLLIQREIDAIEAVARDPATWAAQRARH